MDVTFLTIHQPRMFSPICIYCDTFVDLDACTTIFVLFSYVGENMVEVAILAPLAILIEGPISM